MQFDKDEFSLSLLKRHKETNEDLFDIIMEVINDDNIEIYIDNVKRFLSDDIKSRLEKEMVEKNLIKGKHYKEGLTSMFNNLVDD